MLYRDRRTTILIAGAALAVALLLLVVLLNRQGSFLRGAVSPEDLVRVYLHALRDRDESQIQRLVLGGYDPTEEIARRVSQFGGIDPETVSVTYARNPVAPYVIDVDLLIPSDAVTYPNKVFSDRLVLQSNNGRWFLVLGTYQSPEQ